jgi:hypothetical protein
MKRSDSLPTTLRLVAVATLGWTFANGGLASAGDAPDLDGDGIPNIVDPDIDNDGLPNGLDDNVDGGIAKSGPYAGQYIGDHLRNDNPAETDIDDDGLADDSLGETDIDGDGMLDDDAGEQDIDGDGRNDTDASERDIDGDGRRDNDDDEDDLDGDGLDDDDPLEDDIDGDNLPDGEDDDIDGDGLLNGDPAELDTDGDGKPDDSPEEDDVDGDEIADRFDPDDDNDGELDEDDPDHVGDADEEEVEDELTPTASAPAESEAVVRLQQLGTGKTEFGLEVHGLAAGNYEIVVNGVVRGTLVMIDDDGEAEGEIEFETAPIEEEEILLDFPVIGLPVSVRQSGIDYFTGTIPTPPTP